MCGQLKPTRIRKNSKAIFSRSNGRRILDNCKCFRSWIARHGSMLAKRGRGILKGPAVFLDRLIEAIKQDDLSGHG
jgi:hypothetical protein